MERIIKIKIDTTKKDRITIMKLVSKDKFNLIKQKDEILFFYKIKKLKYRVILFFLGIK